MARAYPEHDQGYRKLLNKADTEETVIATNNSDTAYTVSPPTTPPSSGDRPAISGVDILSKLLLVPRPEFRSSSPERNPNDVTRARKVARMMTAVPYRLCTACFFLISIGIYLVASYALQPMVQRRIHDTLVLKPNTSDSLKEARADVLVRVYLFNVTNPQGALKKGENFKLQELGPYVYRVDPNKIDIEWNPNSTVSYRVKNICHLEPNMTNGSLDDIVRTVDVPYLAIPELSGDSGIQSVLTKLVQIGDKLFTTQKVGDILWGYQDYALERTEFIKSLDYFNLLDDVPPNFGFLTTANLNDTPSEMYNQYTGESDFSKLNEIYSYGYKRYLTDSVDDRKETLHGSVNGCMFPPPVQKDSSLSMFFGYLMKILSLEYDRVSSYKNLQTYRFHVPDSQFSLRVIDHLNASRPDDVKYKYLKGITSMGPVSQGAPLYLSFPHFLGADEVLTERIEGIQPHERLHRSHLDINPLTGVTPHLVVRTQINVRVNVDGPGSKTDGDSNYVYLPLIWIEVEGHAKDDALDKLLEVALIVKMVEIGILVSFGLVCFMSLLVLAQILTGCFQHCKLIHG